MDEIAVVERLRQLVDNETLSEIGRQLGVSKQYLCDVLKGRKAPGPKIFKAMGIKRRVVYTKDR